MTNLAHASGSPENQEEARKIMERLGFPEVAPRSRVEGAVISMLGALAEGKNIQVIEEDNELTPTEAAKILNVSRAYLDKLLKLEKIPYHNIPGSTHRKILLKDVVAFKELHRKDARESLRRLNEVSKEMGLDY